MIDLCKRFEPIGGSVLSLVYENGADDCPVATLPGADDNVVAGGISSWQVADGRNLLMDPLVGGADNGGAIGDVDGRRVDAKA